MFSNTTFLLQREKYTGEISIDFGEPFTLFVSLDIKTVKFGFKFNGDVLEKYDVPIPYPDIENMMVGGDMSVNYVGFSDPGNCFLKVNSREIH